MAEDIEGRVTVHLAGLKPGDKVLVDPEDPDIAIYLRDGIVVADEPEQAGGGRGDAPGDV